jgi:hypothetical protein
MHIESIRGTGMCCVSRFGRKRRKALVALSGSSISERMPMIRASSLMLGRLKAGSQEESSDKAGRRV